MVVNGENLPTIEVYSSMLTVPDCMVVGSNKIGRGNGEAKFYIGSKDEMHMFFGTNGFNARCFMLKKDLIFYLNAIKTEYFSPSQPYRSADDLKLKWNERLQLVKTLPDVITFGALDQTQIDGPRGYINSPDPGYQLLRQLALPLVSYVYIEKVGLESEPLFYWKLFVDFNAIWERKNGPLVFSYGKRFSVNGKRKDEPAEESEKAKQELYKMRVRKGQEKYRAQLLEQCPYCPFTMISEERLLIASHIKPWAASTVQERIDPYNGYMLSPLYDRLFDQGFLTFREDKHIVLSETLSPYTWKKLGLENDKFLPTLPMDDKRIEYLQFHHESVFKGSYE